MAETEPPWKENELADIQCPAISNSKFG